MKPIAKVAALLILSLTPFAVIAQTSESEQEQQPEQVLTFNRAGDHYINVSMGATFPTNFPDMGSLFTDNRKLSTGGLGNLGYHYFITDSVSVGGEAGFGFNVTIGSHVLNYVPLVARVTYHPEFGKIEVPLSLGLGFSWHSYVGETYFPGLVVKPEVGVHFRISSSWSAGFDLAWLYIPEFSNLYDKSQPNNHANFVTASITARYFF